MTASWRSRSAAPFLAAVAIVVASTGQLGNAVANGDTRTLEIYHTHTKESVAITYKRNGSYDRTGLDKLNWALRDWRRDEPTKMDPRLFDIAWEVHRAVGSEEPLHVVSAYRAPETNAMLRRRSRGVAKHSQHMEGKAMDFYLPDVSMAKVREIGLRMQRGGVGYYPSSANSFVHLDAGSVRHWPRMTRDQLARLFPDGKTVHIPADGKPMPGYDLAAAEIEAGGGTVTAYASDEGGLFSTRRGKSFFAALFGGADEEEDVEQVRPALRQVARRDTGQQPQQQLATVSLASSGDDYGRPVFFANTSIRPSEPVPTAAPRRVVAPAPTPAPEPVATPEPAPAPQQVAALQPRQVWQTGPTGSPLDDVTVGAAIPLPLARPTDIGGLTAYANVPLPPARPVEMAALGAGTAAVLAAQPLQPVAATATAAPAVVTAAPAPLVYANVPLPPPRPALPGGTTVVAAARPAPAQVTMPTVAPAAASARSAADDLTPGMMDRAALRALFANAAIGAPSGGPERTVVATAKARPAERDLTGLTGRPAAAVAGGFAAAPAADMRTDRFTGPAVKAVPVQRFTP